MVSSSILKKIRDEYENLQESEEWQKPAGSGLPEGRGTSQPHAKHEVYISYGPRILAIKQRKFELVNTDKLSVLYVSSL